MIYNYFYILKNNEVRDFYYFEYLSILSLINTQKNFNIIIYKINNIKGKYYNIFKKYSNIFFREIDIYIDNFNDKKNNYNNFKYSLINTIGGIYVDFRVIFISSIELFLEKYLFHYSDILIGGNKNNYFLKNKIIQQKENIKLTEPYIEHYNKQFIEYFKIDENSIEIINNDNEEIISKEITDWNFNKYFEIIENKLFIVLDFDEVYLHKLENTIHNNKINEISNKIYITILNLLLIYILTYKSTKISKEEINININKNLAHNKKINCINSIKHIYWINLELSKKRREKMEIIFKNINIPNTRINAINGITEELEIKSKYFEKENCIEYPKNTNIEYAVILSHLKALEEVNKNNINNNIDNDNDNDICNNVSLICEDDLSLEFISYWYKSIDTIINDAPKDWEIIMLGHFTLDINFDSDYRKWDNDWSALSYLINHKSLHKLNSIKKDNKYKIYNDVMAADNYLFRVFNTYVYKYPYFTFPKKNESTIHNDHLLYHSIYKNINYLILDNKLSYL